MKPRTISPRPRRKASDEPKASNRGDSGDRDVRVLRQFRQIFNAVKAHFQDVERSAGIGGAQLWALSVIYERPGIGVNDLAAAIDIHQSTASNLVKGLVERNLVAASRHAQDKRTVQLEVLSTGRQVLKRAPGPFSGVLPQALQTLDARSLASLERVLSKLIATLGADERAGRVPLAHTLTKTPARLRPPKS